MKYELKFSEIEQSIRDRVATGDDRVSFNLLYMSLAIAEIDRLRDEKAKAGLHAH